MRIQDIIKKDLKEDKSGKMTEALDELYNKEQENEKFPEISFTVCKNGMMRMLRPIYW